MQVTYKVEGEPLEQLPDAYSEHYVQVGFWRDYTQGYDKKETFSHAYVNAAGEIYFVDCSIITAYGQIETFDNEHAGVKLLIGIPSFRWRHGKEMWSI